MKRVFAKAIRAILWAAICLAATCALAEDSALREPNKQAETSVRFNEDVFPILSQHCFRCHSEDEKSGGLAMTDQATLVEGGDSGPAIVIGNSKQSLLIERITDPDPDIAMPPEGERLSQDQIDILRAWIDQGAPWDNADDYCLELKEVAVPDGNGNPIDRLLARYLQRHQLQLGSPVSDELFARRVALDLVGVPLDSDQLAEFLADTHPGKREQLVDRLLSDHDNYVAHWMTFWSDHLRIGSDVAVGIFDSDETKAPQEWLRNELTRDVSFDQFVRDLITGDFVEQYGRSVAPPGEVASHVDLPEMQLSATVSQVFLGIQLKCASCHDSFVDRWKLKDAWGLAAALNEKGRVDIYRCDLPTGQTAIPAFPLKGLGEIDPHADKLHRRRQVADMLTTDQNGLFARTIVNRIWARLFGHGFIEPLDEMMEHDPWDDDLMDWLSADFVRHGYDLKQLLKQIVTSQAYQAASVAREDASSLKDYAFQGPEIRRLTAEQFHDSITELHPAPQQRAWQHQNNRLMTILGRPSRDVVVTARDQECTPLMELELINGDQLEGLISRTAAAQLDLEQTNPQVVARIFHVLLGREPRANELAICVDDPAEPLSQDNIGDLIWTIVMLPEFQLIQ